MEFASLHIIDWGILVGYMGLLLLIGFLFKKKAGQGLVDFFLSGRSIPWWLVGTSTVAAHFGASKPIQVVQMVREYGIEHVWFFWYAIPATIIGAITVAKLWRRTRIITQVELIRVRYSGPGVHFLTLWQALFEGVFMKALAIGISLVALERLIEVLMPGVDPTLIIVLICCVALAYTALSGLYAVVVTDFVQFLVGALGSLILVVLIYVHFGSPAGLVEAVKALPGKETLTNIIPAVPEAGATLAEKLKFFDVILYMFVLWLFHGFLVTAGSGPQRLMASKNERHATLMCIWADVVDYGILHWLWIIIGLGSLVMLGNVNHEHAFIKMGVDHLPVVLKGIFVASIFAALMSTIDTHLNMTASFVVNDLYKNYLVKKAPNRHYIRVSRITTVVFMCAGIGMWQICRQTTLLNNMKVVMMLYAGGGLVQFVQWFWYRVNAWAVVSGMVGSVIITTLLKWGIPSVWPWFASLKLTTEHYPIGLILIVMFTTITWVTVALLTKPSDMNILKNFYRRTRPMGFWKPVREVLGPEIEGDRFRWNDMTALLFGVMAVYGFIFGLGNCLLGSYISGIVLLVVSFVGLKGLLWSLSKNAWWTRDIDAQQAAEEQSESL